MTVHIGQITSEVRTTAAVEDDERVPAPSHWDEQLRMTTTLERLARDRRRTSTGCADD